MSTHSRNLLIILLLFAWLLITLTGYYAIHKPISPEQIVTLARSGLNLLLGIWLGLLFGGLGRWLCPMPDLPVVERATVQAALGFGLVALLWLGLGALGLFSRLTSWLVLGVFTVLLLRPAFGWVTDFLIGLQQLWPQSWIARFSAGFTILVTSFTLLTALAPPYKWDALVYHLDLPRHYLAARGLIFLPQQPFWGQPQLVEMNFTWAMGLLDASTAVVSGWIVALIFLLGMLGLTARLANIEAAWVALAAVLAGASVRGTLGWGYVDIYGAFFALALLVLFLQIVKTNRIDRGQLLAIGLLIGLAASVKYTNLLVFPLTVLLGLIFFPQPLIDRLRSTAVILGIGLIVFSPWLLRNTLTTGNPLYPYLIPTEMVNSHELAFESHETVNTTSALRFVTLPFELTWFGVEGADGYASDIGVLLLMLAVPGGFAAWKFSSGQVSLAWALFGWLSMAAASQFSPLLLQTRLYYLFLPAVGLLAGWGWQQISHLRFQSVRIRRVAGGLVSFILLLAVLEGLSAFVDQEPIRVLIGQESEQAYLERNLGGYAIVMQAISESDPEFKTLFLWEPRGFYAPLASISDPWISHWYAARRSLGCEECILDFWRSAGYERLVVFRSGMEFEQANRTAYIPEDWLVLENLLATLPAIPGDFPGYELYRIP